MTATPPDRAFLDTQVPHYLSRGRAANADVRLLTHGQQQWVVKDFSACPWLIRHTIGRWMVSRELRALQTLAGIRGIPEGATRIDAFAFSYHFIEGQPLAKVPGKDLSPSFFMSYEELVIQMHKRGLAHLDLRNSGNVLIDLQGRPMLIDFQSYLRLPRWFPALARYLQKIDLSGVYKLWNNRLPGTMSEDRQQLLDHVNNWRKGWIFSNYLGLRRFFRERD